MLLLDVLFVTLVMQRSGNQPNKLLSVTVSLLFLSYLEHKTQHNTCTVHIHNLCANRNAWLPTSDNLSGFGQLMQWSVRQNDVSLIVTWPVWYVLQPLLRTTESQVHQLFWFQSNKYCFLLNQFKILVCFNLQKLPPRKLKSPPKSLNLANHKIAPTMHKIAPGGDFAHVEDHSCKQRGVLSRIELGRDYGGHLVNQPCFSVFEKCWKTIPGNEIITVRKTTKHRIWWRKCTDESACLCTQMSGSNLIEGFWCG